MKDQREDPVTENMDFMVGHGPKVFPDQDHEAHIAIHTNFAQTQATENAELYAHIDPAVQAHIMEHKAYLYRQQVEADLGISLPYKDLDDDTDQEDLPAEVERMISMAVAKKLRPPPPSPQQSQEQQAAQQTLTEAQAKDDARDIETIGKMKRADSEHAAKLAREKQAFDAEQQRKSKEFASEQRRQDDEHRAEMRRKQREGAVEIDITKKKAKATFAGAKKTTAKKKKK
jgi:hypothetical protein